MGGATRNTYEITSESDNVGERIVVYGVGGIGKTSLCTLAPRPLFLSLDKDKKIHAPKVKGLDTWQDIRNVVQSSQCDPFQTIVLDSATSMNDLAVAHTLKTRMHPKHKTPVKDIEGYDFGKGYQYNYETWMLLLADLDRLREAGKDVVLICHSTVTTAPNPDGEDWIEYQPDLQQPNKIGRLRDKIHNWCDHMFFVNYDTSITDGKAKSGGTRAIYPRKLPTCWAKSRDIEESIVFPKGDDRLWRQLKEARNNG